MNINSMQYFYETNSYKRLTYEFVSYTIKSKLVERREDMMKFTVRELRARHRITQAQMAEKLGISIGCYNNWENNFWKVKTKDADRIAKILNVKLDDILILED